MTNIVEQNVDVLFTKSSDDGHAKQDRDDSLKMHGKFNGNADYFPIQVMNMIT